MIIAILAIFQKLKSEILNLNIFKINNLFNITISGMSINDTIDKPILKKYEII